MPRRGQNIYKRKDGRWEGRYIKGYDIAGKPQTGYVYGKTYKDAKEKLESCKLNSQKSNSIISTNILLNDWIEIWIKSQRQIKDTTKMTYKSILKNHIQNSIGKMALKKLNEDVLQSFIDDESEKYSAKTVHSVFSMLRLTLNAAYHKNYIQNIYNEIRLPKIKKHTAKVLTKQEQKQLESVILVGKNRYDIGILICLYTGVRIGELCALKWENINLNNQTITIKETVQRVKNDSEKSANKTKIKFDTPKSLTSIRTIPIPKFLAMKLKKYQRKTGYILRNDGQFTDTRNISRRFKQLLKEAKIENINFHALRHTFATRALELGFDIKTLSEILGHSSVTITLNLYVHTLPEHKQKEMEKFNSLFNNPSN